MDLSDSVSPKLYTTTQPVLSELLWNSNDDDLFPKIDCNSGGAWKKGAAPRKNDIDSPSQRETVR